MIAAGIILATVSVYDRFTWHSARVTLACQLRKLNYGWDKITSHLRHKSAESARIYGRLDAISYADTAAKALRADASGVLAADLPEIDPVTKHAGMRDAIAAMEAMVVADDDKLNDKASRRVTSARRTLRSERPLRSWQQGRQLRKHQPNGSPLNERRKVEPPGTWRALMLVRTRRSRPTPLTLGALSGETCPFPTRRGEASSTMAVLRCVA